MAHWSSEQRAGAYVTVIVHLAVIVVLLLSGVSAQMGKENTFVIDFTREEEIERQKQEARERDAAEAFDEAIARRIEELISGSSGTDFRNTAVDRNSLKDDRGTDADKLYEDARRLAQDLRNGYAPDEPDEDYVPVSRKKDPQTSRAQSYSGPSVVSWSLDGRKASRLPIPAYRCFGGGMVTVLIKVDPAGNVVDARVQDETSSSDKCLRDFAVRAARMSKFSMDKNAPARQAGDIVYQFIAQ